MPLDTTTPAASPRSARRYSRLVLLGLGLAVLSALGAMTSGLGHRWGWWDFGDGFTLLKWAFYGGIAACLVSALGALLTRTGARRRGLGAALSGVLISGLVVWVPGQSLQQIRALPPIHDITTDTNNPPAFSAVLSLRGSQSNSTDYAGAAVAELQRQGYPDIQPIEADVSAGRAYTIALEVVQRLGWELVASEAATGRIEATDTTLWFGFKDDVVIRITPREAGARVDLRSVSRVGGSDVGANAARIRDFVALFKEHSN